MESAVNGEEAHYSNDHIFWTNVKKKVKKSREGEKPGPAEE